VAPSREWVEELRETLPELPAVKRRRLIGEWGFTDVEMRDVINAGALELIEETVAAGTAPAAARKWWMGELARNAKEQEIELSEVSVTPAQIAELQGLIEAKRINDKIGRQVLEAVLAGEGNPEAIVVAKGLEIVSDDGALLTVIDETLAAQPDIVEKVKSGNMGPIGAIIGAVMKATKGQADAGRVRELVLERINN
jgi:aspartyl-tRNA(Asn)/glutamyl-tRNA(Gln) amidotransferase subunit B